MDLDKITLGKMIAFNNLVRCKTFSRCAVKVRVTQSKIHNDIKSLEKSLGYKVFVRNKREIVLTQKGKKFYRFSHHLCGRMNDYKTDKNFDSNGRFDFTVACTHGIANSYLPKTIDIFLKKYAYAKIHILSGCDYLDFESTKCDLSIGPPMAMGSDLQQSVVRKYSYGYFASKEYINQYGHLNSADEIGNHKFLALKGFFPLPKKFADLNLIKVESTSYKPLLDLAIKGVGIISLPLGYKSYENSRLFRVLKDYESEHESIMTTFCKHSPKKKIIECFVKEFKSIVNQGV